MVPVYTTGSPVLNGHRQSLEETVSDLLLRDDCYHMSRCLWGYSSASHMLSKLVEHLQTTQDGWQVCSTWVSTTHQLVVFSTAGNHLKYLVIDKSDNRGQITLDCSKNPNALWHYTMRDMNIHFWDEQLPLMEMDLYEFNRFGLYIGTSWPHNGSEGILITPPSWRCTSHFGYAAQVCSFTILGLWANVSAFYTDKTISCIYISTEVYIDWWKRSRSVKPNLHKLLHSSLSLSFGCAIAGW